MGGAPAPLSESPDRSSLISPDSRSALTVRDNKARDGGAPGGLVVSTNEYGSIRKVTNDEWCADLYRLPTRMTPEKKLFSEQCRAAEPPATYQRNYHSPSMPQMIRCPIGGGSCKNGLINVRNSKAAINSHFNMHHRSRGEFFRLKIEGATNAFTYTTCPLGRPPADTQGEKTLKETVGRGPLITRQPLITPMITDRSMIATPISGMERLRSPKKRREGPIAERKNAS